MTLFLTQEEAEALLTTVDRVPGYTYTVMPGACGPGFGITVFNSEGVLLTESYTPELGLPAPNPDPEPETENITELLRLGGEMASWHLADSDEHGEVAREFQRLFVEMNEHVLEKPPEAQPEQ